jgi:hypothetical protein
MTADTPSGEAAKEIVRGYDDAHRLAILGSVNLLDYVASIIERHCPSPDIAGMQQALEDAEQRVESHQRLTPEEILTLESLRSSAPPALLAMVDRLAVNRPSDLAGMRKAHLLVLDGLLPEILGKTGSYLSPHLDKTAPPHLAWMIGEANRRQDMPLDKLARWTGFIQGVMAAHGWLNVDEERNRTRPIFAAARQ